MRLIAALSSLLVLGACCTTQPALKVCAPLVTYTPAQEAAVAVELKTLPANDPVAAFIVDYGRERQMLRTCAKP